MNKKGILRIIEASIAVLIILTVILTFALTKRVQTEKDLSVLTGPLLDEMAKDNVLRVKIISNSSDVNTSITNFLFSKVRDPNLCYQFRICDVKDLCSLSSYPTSVNGNVYADSRIISSSLTSSKSKRVSLFMWVNAGKGCS